MTNRVLILICIISLMTILSCSKTKYRGVRQYYVNFTSYYNTYFNIQHRYKVGYRSSIMDKQENISDIISVFDYENDPEFFIDNQQFKETGPKVSKLLALRPNSKWIDDALLTEGKIRYLKGDLDSALLILNYLVDQYPKGYVSGHLPNSKLKGYDKRLIEAQKKGKPITSPFFFGFCFGRNEGQLWLIKTLIKKKQFERAQSLINTATDNLDFPQEMRKDLEKTQSMLYIESKNLPKASESLLKVLEFKNLNKRERSRINFILAQIFEKTNDFGQAQNYFKAALDGKLREDLEFEARLKSLSYTESNPDASLKMLKRMLNKGKYEKSMDKIYLAMGDVYLKKDEINNATSNYQKAIAYAKNPNLKFVIFEKLGNVFYNQSKYVYAAQYYDSASMIIPDNYPNKDAFTKKAEALKKLLVHYNIYQENDSILDLAALGPDEAKKKIEKNLRIEVAEMKKRDAEKSNKKEENKDNSSKWYYSIQSNVEEGRTKFQKTWGKIQLQENWKRSSAAQQLSSNSSKTRENGQVLDETSIELVAEVEAFRLPFSAEKKKPLISKTQTALINMARIYQYDIKDQNKSIETYELLFKKYGDNLENEDEHLYSLYLLYVEKDKIKLADEIKTKLISKYPHSKYSTYAINPLAKSEDERLDLALSRRYREAYNEYRNANYSQSLAQCEAIETEYPKHSLICKVKLLKAFIYSYTSRHEDYAKTLNLIIAECTGTEEAKTAQEYLNILKDFNPNADPNAPKLPVDKISDKPSSSGEHKPSERLPNKIKDNPNPERFEDK